MKHLTGDELAGCWRALCGMCLAHTVVAFRRRSMHRKEDVTHKKTAKSWLSGGGEITFLECCEAMDVDQERAGKALMGIALKAESGTTNRVVYGVRINAN